MRYLILLACLAGCTTTEEIRQHQPRASYSSTKSVGALVECLTNEVHRGQPSVIPGEAATYITWGTAIAVGLHITLRPATAGTNVEVRELVSYTERGAVERCV